MNQESVFKSTSNKILPPNYLSIGLEAIGGREQKFRILVEERKWPKEGWDDLSITLLLNYLSSMDSNNFLAKGSVGEREGRVFCKLVQNRHYSFSHGIGRSGDLGENQPKAVGSSLLSNLTNGLVLDLLQTLVSRDVEDAFLVPMATGMTLTLVFLTLKREKPKAKFVIWTRIDQKSCFKSITCAGLEPLVIPGKLVGDEIRTNSNEIESVLGVYGPENVLCVLSTTSSFAPRSPDSLETISKTCQQNGIFHVVNNAYGLQSSKCIAEILSGAKTGGLDVFVQSTDKNLMVPVGGAIVAGFNKTLLQKIRQNYPGRASSSQSIDVLMTLLSMGREGYVELLSQRRSVFEYLKESLGSVGAKWGERVLQSPHNQISIGLSLGNLCSHFSPEDTAERDSALTSFGSMLFRRNVLGVRIITTTELKTIEGHQFRGWGAGVNEYPVPYLTAAASLGIQRQDVDYFIKKLDECFKKFLNKGRSRKHNSGGSHSHPSSASPTNDSWVQPPPNPPSPSSTTSKKTTTNNNKV